MNSVRVFLTTFLIIALALPVGSSAQGRMKRGGSSGWGMGSDYNRIYDPATVETVTGEVVRVDKIVPARGISYGIHLTLKTDTGTVSIHVGPAWYIENQDTKIAVRDRIEVKGSRVSFQGKPAVIAAEIRKGDEVLTLRDSLGFPLWSGWRRR